MKKNFKVEDAYKAKDGLVKDIYGKRIPALKLIFQRNSLIG